MKADLREARETGIESWRRIYMHSDMAERIFVSKHMRVTTTKIRHTS